MVRREIAATSAILWFIGLSFAPAPAHGVFSDAAFRTLACPTLFGRSVSAEARFGELYGKLLEQYRAALGDDAVYATRLSALLNAGDYYDLPASTAALTATVSLFDRLRAIEAAGRLPGGEAVAAAEIRSGLRARIEAILRSVGEIHGSVKDLIREKEKLIWPVRKLEGHGGAILDIRVSADRKRAVTAAEGGDLILWNLGDGKVLRRIKVDARTVERFEVSPDFRSVVCLDSNLKVTVWDLETGTLRRRIGGVHYQFLSVSPDFKRAVTSGGESLTVWDLKSGRARFVLSEPGRWIKGLTVRGDFKRAVAFTDEGAFVWDLEKGKLHHTLPIFGLRELGVGADFRHALSRTYIGEELPVWDLESGKAVASLEIDVDSTEGVFVSADSSRAIVLLSEGPEPYTLWNLETGARIRNLAVNGDFLQASDDFRRVVFKTKKGLELWDAETGTLLHSIEASGKILNISRDLRRAVMQNDNVILLINLDIGRVVGRLESHLAEVQYAVVSEDFTRLWSGASDGEILEWDLPALGRNFDF